LALKNYLNINILTETETQPGNSDGCHIAPQHNVVRRDDSDSSPHEVSMTALVKNTGWAVVRWFKHVAQKNKTPYRWYEVDPCGM
jgi:hypothetical protein